MITEFVQAVNATIREHLKAVHTVVPGRIIKFDREKCRATVLPLVNYKKKDGTYIPYPQITGVPVWSLQSNKQLASIILPVSEGDDCILLISEQSLDYWEFGQETSSDLMFDLTNSICIPGLFAAPNPMVSEATEKNALIVSCNGSIIEVSRDNVTVKSDSVNVIAQNALFSGDVNISGNLSVGGLLSPSSCSLK